MAGNLNPQAFQWCERIKARLRRELPRDILECNGWPVRQAILLEWLAIAEIEFFHFWALRVEKIKADRIVVRRRLAQERLARASR